MVFSPEIAGLASLNIGCGLRPLPNFVNCDVAAAPGVDRVFDAQKKWPFANDSAKAIYVSHVIEHLSNPLGFFDEAWRVLHSHGSMVARVPHVQHRHSWADPTHLRLWSPEAFYWLQEWSPQTWSHCPGFMTRDKFWAIEIVAHVLAKDKDWANRFPLRPFLGWAIDNLWNICLEMVVWMRPKR